MQKKNNKPFSYTIADPDPLLDASIFENLTDKERQQIKIKLQADEINDLKQKFVYAVMVNVALLFIIFAVLVFGN